MNNEASYGMPIVCGGRVERLGVVPSAFVTPRLVDVWLPEEYDASKRYAVLYMHDGQAIFDGASCISHTGWHVDAAIDALRPRLRDTIVVGVWNTGDTRAAEYFPQKALAHLPEPSHSIFVRDRLMGQPKADDYLRFLVEELKPLIDQRYPTLPDAPNTFIMGSSMGGLISLYAICEYPEVFSAAACLSTHWIGTYESNGAIPLALFTYLQECLPDPATHRIYMDRGDATLDAQYPVHQSFADVLLHEKGYSDGNFQSLAFPGAAHTESDWAQRLDRPLVFLLSKFNH
jgi:predicted alpha/beta superfamily hydrolase